jgi:hypothetical protein
MDPLIRAAGAHTVTALKIPLIWFYITAILFITTLNNLQSFDNISWLKWVSDLPASVRGIVQGLIPVRLNFVCCRTNERTSA